MPTSGIGIVTRDSEGRYTHTALRAAYANEFDSLRRIYNTCHVGLSALNLLLPQAHERPRASDLGAGPLPSVPSSRPCRLSVKYLLSQVESLTAESSTASSVWRGQSLISLFTIFHPGTGCEGPCSSYTGSPEGPASCVPNASAWPKIGWPSASHATERAIVYLSRPQ